MSAQHPHAAPAEPAAGRFVSLSLPTGGTADDDGGEPGRGAAGDVVLARLDDDLRPDAVVLARGDGSALEVRRVGRLDADCVELLPVDAAAPPRVVPRRGGTVLGTVVLRWREG